MKRSSSLSRTFFRRPAVRRLVPDLKLVLVVLTIGCESHTGVYRPAGLAEDTGLDPSALKGGMADLEREGHVLQDNKTGEVFLRAWYRDNSFNTDARRGQWRDDFRQIESLRLRALVEEAISASPECGLKVQNVDNSNEKQENQPVNSQGEGEGEVKTLLQQQAAVGSSSNSFKPPTPTPSGSGNPTPTPETPNPNPSCAGGMEPFSDDGGGDAGRPVVLVELEDNIKPLADEILPLLHDLDQATAQAVADELSGGLEAGKVGSPIGWVRRCARLARGEEEGGFTPSRALGVQKARAARKAADARKRAEEAAAAMAAVEEQERIAQALEKMGLNPAQPPTLGDSAALRRALGMREHDTPTP